MPECNYYVEFGEEAPTINTDSQYYFVLGHVVRYFLEKIERQEGTLSMDTWANKFHLAQDPQYLKQRMHTLITKYPEFIHLNNVSLKRAIALVFGYAPNDDKRDERQFAYMQGFFSNSQLV